MQLEGNVTREYGAPKAIYLQVEVSASSPTSTTTHQQALSPSSTMAINATLTLLHKPTYRGTESASLRFAPSPKLVSPDSLQLHKVASWIGPRTVAENGSKHLHYMSDLGARWNLSTTNGQSNADSSTEHPSYLSMRSIDAGLVAVGEDARPVPTLFTVDPSGVQLPQALSPHAIVNTSEGIAVGLFNNLWQTNYVSHLRLPAACWSAFFVRVLDSK